MTMQPQEIRSELGKLNRSQRRKLRSLFPCGRTISYARVEDDFDHGHRALRFAFENQDKVRYYFFGPRGAILDAQDPYKIN